MKIIVDALKSSGHGICHYELRGVYPLEDGGFCSIREG